MNTELENVKENPYVSCLRQQLEEIDLLSSIYCSPGELHILDSSVISDFNDFLERPASQQIDESTLKSHLDFTVRLKCGEAEHKIEVRIELPYLYPLLENPIVVVHGMALSKLNEQHIHNELEQYIGTLGKGESYIFQVISWLQDFIEKLLERDLEGASSQNLDTSQQEECVEFERLWIYTHHMKAKSKRLEILRQARSLQLSGFSRPGKPGIICVEGVHQNAQEFWRTIKAMHWQKINVCKSELTRVTSANMEQKRRFVGFKEQLFCDGDADDEQNEDAVMDMAMFVKYLETHKSGYMKKELFGFD